MWKQTGRYKGPIRRFLVSHQLPAWILYDRVYYYFIFILFAHTSDVKQTSDRHHEHSDEHNADKHVCIVHSVQNNPSKMADDHPCRNVHEKYLLSK